MKSNSDINDNVNTNDKKSVSIGEKLKILREKNNFSGSYVAKELGISKSTISRYDSGKIASIPIDIFNRYCEIIGENPQTVLSDTPVPFFTKSSHDSANDIHTYLSNKAPVDGLAELLKSGYLDGYVNFTEEQLNDDDFMKGSAERFLALLKILNSSDDDFARNLINLLSNSKPLK